MCTPQIDKYIGTLYPFLHVLWTYFDTSFFIDDEVADDRSSTGDTPGTKQAKQEERMEVEEEEDNRPIVIAPLVFSPSPPRRPEIGMHSKVTVKLRHDVNKELVLTLTSVFSARKIHGTATNNYAACSVFIVLNHFSHPAGSEVQVVVHPTPPTPTPWQSPQMEPISTPIVIQPRTEEEVYDPTPSGSADGK